MLDQRRPAEHPTRSTGEPRCWPSVKPEQPVTITIDNLTVADNVPTGTAVGTLTALDNNGGVVACNFRLTKGSGNFAISTDKLVTAWTGSLAPSPYSVR